MAKTTKTQKPDTSDATSPQKPAFLADNSTIKLTIPWSKIQPAYESTLKKLSKQVKLDGFRKGKIPAKLIEESVRPDHIIEHTLEAVLPDVYTAALKDSKHYPISYPEFKPITTEKGQDWEVEAIFAERPPIQIKDYKKIVLDARKEAEKEQTADAKDAQKSEKSESKNDQEAQKNQAILEKIYRALITKIQPAVPELLLRQEARRELQHLADQLANMKLSVEDYLKQRGMQFEQLSQEITISVLGRLQLGFILEEIMSTEKIEVTEDDIKTHIVSAVAPAMRDEYEKNERYQSAVKESLLRQKIADFLLKLK